MKSLKFLALPLFILAGFATFGQLYPINDFDGQEIDTCTGTFTDSGGDFDTPYQVNENYSVTFCSDDSENPVLVVHFDNFQLGPGDVLRVYDGVNSSAPWLWEATGTELQGKSIYASNGCLHFEFISSPSEPGNGWSANMSCLSICETFEVVIEPQGGSFNFCPEVGQVFFSASAYYLPQNLAFDPVSDPFSWNIDGTSYEGQNQTHTFVETGIYPVSVSVHDPDYNCTANDQRYVKLGTVPSLEGTKTLVDSVCAKETFTLSGRATTNIWTSFPSSNPDTLAIPDGTGLVYETTIDFDDFDPAGAISPAAGIGKVCVDLEHSRQGHLRIELECPQGNRTTLKGFSTSQANLGEPVVWNNFNQGVPYTYCFSNTATRTINGTTPSFQSYTDQVGNFYANASYIPAGTYRPDQAFQFLDGCQLNGEWKLIITDNVEGDNGFVFGWELFFDESLYQPSQVNWPRIVDEKWYRGAALIGGNPATTSVDQHGDHEFRFVATDSYGCSYDTLVSIYVKKLPEAEITLPLGKELPVCRGDSILLTLTPINIVNPNWSYQWVEGTTPIPDETGPTRMARMPSLYKIRVTDNDTGCSEFFEITVTDQDCQLEIPNVFTPNGDGVNDFFEIRNLEHFTGSIVIYNRWGKVMYEHSDYYNNWWDGEGAPDGTYYYVLTYERDGEIERAHGVITILRGNPN